MTSQSADGTVEFAFYRPGARSVRLAADFNLWDATCHELEPAADGWWRLSLRVEVGSYRFKYVVDGHVWETDYAAGGVEQDGHGGWNSLLVVEDAAALAAAKIDVDAILDEAEGLLESVSAESRSSRGSDIIVPVIDRDAELSRIARAADELHAARRAA